MINHAYRMLYGLTNRSNPSGIYVDNSSPVSIPDRLRLLWSRMTRETAEGADTFAIRALKILDGSSYRGEVTKYDPRLTYQVEALVISDINLVPFMNQLLETSPDAVQYILSPRQELEKTFRQSDTLQEVAASLITGYVDRMSEANA